MLYMLYCIYAIYIYRQISYDIVDSEVNLRFEIPCNLIIVIMMLMMNCFLVWLTDEMLFALFPAGTIVRDPHHSKSPTRRGQDLSLHRTKVQDLLNEADSDNYCTTELLF